MGKHILCIAMLCLMLFYTFTCHAGQILSFDSSVEEIDPLKRTQIQENLLESMDLKSLSPHAYLLRLHPMVTEKLAVALRQGKVKIPDKEWQRIISKASALYNLPESLIASVIRAESSFNPHAVSSKGAQGAMQIMPGTQKYLGLENPYDPEANVLSGSRYLKEQLDRFGSIELAIAAYNAGPGNVMKYGGIPPFAETQEYVRRVLSYAGQSGMNAYEK